MAARSRATREEQADALCETIRQYLVDHDCEVVVHVNLVPDGVWDEQPGTVTSPSVKREIVGSHVIQYWKDGS